MSSPLYSLFLDKVVEVKLCGGETVRGRLVAVDTRSLMLETEDGPVIVAAPRVVAIKEVID